MTDKNYIYGTDYLRDLGEQVSKEQLEAVSKTAQLFASTFSSAEGQRVLEILKGYLEVPTWDPNENHNHGYFREGQNSVVRFIINQVNYNKRGK